MKLYLLFIYNHCNIGKSLNLFLQPFEEWHKGYIALRFSVHPCMLASVLSWRPSHPGFSGSNLETTNYVSSMPAAWSSQNLGRLLSRCIYRQSKPFIIKCMIQDSGLIIGTRINLKIGSRQNLSIELQKL